MKRLLAWPLLAGALLAVGVEVLAAPVLTWQREITPPDRKRLAQLWEAWTRSLNEAQAAGQGAALVALGPVVVPDAAAINPDAAAINPDAAAGKTAGPLPGAGSYTCREVRLGQHRSGITAWAAATLTASEMRPCRIEVRGSALWFEQDAGAQRLGGRLYADGDRQVFLGATALTGEMRILPYGADPQRDAVGVLRAIGERRWRLELPWPHWQSNLAIVEITPG
jgi:hypothetical protein